MESYPERERERHAGGFKHMGGIKTMRMKVGTQKLNENRREICELSFGPL